MNTPQPSEAEAIEKLVTRLRDEYFGYIAIDTLRTVATEIVLDHSTQTASLRAENARIKIEADTLNNAIKLANIDLIIARQQRDSENKLVVAYQKGTSELRAEVERLKDENIKLKENLYDNH